MFKQDNPALEIVCGLDKLLCFTLVSIGASIILFRVVRQQSFVFLRNQTILMLLYSITTLMNGLFLCGFNDKYFNFYIPGEPWYKRVIGIMIQQLLGVTLALFYWNLSFIYWSSA
jgi:hypothetical protein